MATVNLTRRFKAQTQLSPTPTSTLWYACNTERKHSNTVKSILQWSIQSGCLIKGTYTKSTVAYYYLHSQIPWTDIGKYFGMQSRNCCETFFEASRNLHVWQNQKGETEAAGLLDRDPPHRACACSCTNKHYRTQVHVVMSYRKCGDESEAKFELMELNFVPNVRCNLIVLLG